MIEKKLKLSELIDIKFLQEFQDVFAKTTDVASIIVDDVGPVTEPSNFTDFCIKHTRGSSLGFKRCNECDISCGKTAAQTHKPVIYTCHTGLTDFAVPIIVNGEHIGSILGGQVLTEQPDEDHYRSIARELGIDEDEYIVALRKIKIVPLERVKAAANLLYFVAKTISNNSLKNLELIKKNELESLYRKITEKIRSSLDTEKTLTFICEEVAKLFNIQRATVVQFPDPKNYENYKVKLEYKTNFKINGLTSTAYQEKAAAYWGRSLGSGGATIAFDNIQESDTPDYFRECYTALGVKSMIGFPIKKGNTQWGSLVLSEYNNYRHWSDEEKILLETISDQMYIAINQAELYEAVQKTAENERVLRKIMLSSVKTFDFHECVKSIVDEAGRFYKADRCFFVGYDSEIDSNRVVKTYAEYLSSDDIQSQLTNKPDKSLIERLVQLLKLRKVLAIANVEEGAMLEVTKTLLRQLSVKSYLVAPVFYGEINYGAVVWHYVHDYKEFSQEDIAMAQAIANQSAIVIHQSQLYLTIQKNEKYTRTIMDSIKDGIITISDDFVIESCNPSVEAIWGYSLEKVIGQKLDLLLHHDCLNTDKKICLSGKTFFGVKRNGEEFPVEIDVSEINFEDKKSTLLVIRDITERKKMEKMKNEFISTVSHELRTPLTSIKGALGLITSGVLGALPPKINDLANIANNNCSRLTNLINDILDLEKIKAGKYEFKYEELEINSIIEQSVILNQSYADQFGMKLGVAINFDEAYIKADKNRLLQVLSNLISNAVKFSKLGGEVKIISELEGDRIKVSVVDNGIGIPEDSKYKIFQSFSQVDSSDTRSKGGTGLGLSISKLIVEKMGGEIDFESVAQEGSTFFFALPTVIKGEFKSDQGELSELSVESDAW